jgi:hypothetical protein
MTVMSFGISMYQWLSGTGVYISSGGAAVLPLAFISVLYVLCSLGSHNEKQRLDPNVGDETSY